jgi:thiol-disulfide isomerase/thioredoxin
MLDPNVVTGLIVVLAVLGAASFFGLWRRRVDGRVRELDDGGAAGAQAGGRVLSPQQVGAELGSRATLVQFSSAFCQPCRATRAVLSSVAAQTEGVAHVEIDAESHLELVRELGIMRTPTTLILDGAGRITARASGVPRRQQVVAVLGGAMNGPDGRIA